MFFLFKIICIKQCTQYPHDSFTSNEEEENCIFIFITMYIINRFKQLSCILYFLSLVEKCANEKEKKKNGDDMYVKHFFVRFCIYSMTIKLIDWHKKIF